MFCLPGLVSQLYFKIMKKTIILIFAFLPLRSIYAQPGSLDPGFGSGGRVLTSIGGKMDQGFAMDIQSDGKIIVAGSSNNGTNDDFALVRYNTDGTLDLSFDGDGKVITPIGLFNESISAIAIQGDGTIVVAGTVANANTGYYNANIALVRYNTDGSIDKSFGRDGKVIAEIGSGSRASAIHIQVDGKIVVAGSSRAADSSIATSILARYNSNGSLDVNFDNDGIATSPVGSSCLAIQPDGKIIAAGGGVDFAMARFNTDGSLDLSFNNTGKVYTNFSGNERATAIALQEDGKILLAGNRYYGHRNDCILARYNTNGSLDLTFNGGAAFPSFGPTDDYSTGVAIQTDGKIILSGYSFSSNNDTTAPRDNNFAMARYNPNGRPDTTFGKSGREITVIQPDGDVSCAIKLFGSRIYLAGYTYTYASGVSNYKFSIAAYKNDVLALPLTLTDFSADLNNSYVICRWHTTQEINSSHFIVQRSSDGNSYRDIGRVTAAGNVSNAYHFSDDLSSIIQQPSTIYYRLKIMDKDGKFDYSSVAIVKTRQKSSVTILPNPAHAFIQIKGNGLQQMELFNAYGKLLMIKTLHQNNNNILNIAHLPGGVYVVRLKDTHGDIRVEKLVIQ